MSAVRPLEALRDAARRRVVTASALVGMPLLAFVVVAAWRFTNSVTGAIVIAMTGLAALAWWAWRRARAFDTRWLTHALDAARKDFEDSSDLLFTDAETLGPLQRLQRERLQRRTRTGALPDLRPAWPRRGIALAWILAIAGGAALLLYPRAGARAPALAPSAERAPAVPGMPRLVAQALRIIPPAYTGLPARDETVLDAKAPQGSRLQWWLRFEPQPAVAELVFVDGKRLALRRDGDNWIADRMLDASTLYRVVPRGGAMDSRLYRLDAIPDLPPRLKVIAPTQGLTLVQAGQHAWELVYEAEDDYGLAATGELHLTLAQGSGENISFHEQQRGVAGSGSPTRKRYAVRLDFAALGMKVGDDLVAQLVVHDNHAPVPQVARSPSLILRWPAPREELATGIDGVVQHVLPAYFRSQRQIIIDAEALLKERGRLGAPAFQERSVALANDQKLLRLRYGQFLGMEDEGHPQAPPASASAPPKPMLPTNDEEEAVPPPQPSSGEGGHEGDDHDKAGAQPPVFGSDAGITAEFGHVHDQAEATTLLDPQTRATLKQALEQMWQSELALNQGAPQQALPFAYKALEYIKKVQQADRIYLARTGARLPPIDFTRRMTGKRDGISGGALPRSPVQDSDDVPARLWAALESPPAGGAAPRIGGAPGGNASSDSTPSLDDLQRWLRANQGRVADPLSLLAAIERLRADPRCAECRNELRGQLWRALQRPPVAIPRRDAIDAQGRRYLDAIGQGASR